LSSTLYDNTYVKAKTTILLDLLRKFYKDIRFLFYIAGINHCFITSLFINFVKVLRQLRQIQEVMKQEEFNSGKNVKQQSDGAFNASKETEAIKCFALHRIAKSLYHFIASDARLDLVSCNMKNISVSCIMENISISFNMENIYVRCNMKNISVSSITEKFPESCNKENDSLAETLRIFL
jgi:hypothetical protein